MRLTIKYLLVFVLFSFLTDAQDKAENVANPRFLYLSPSDETIGDYMDFMYDNAPSDAAFTALIRVVEINIRQKNWENAVDLLSEFGQDFPEKKAHIAGILKILKDKEYHVFEINIGDGVNSPQQERTPIQTADENTLYFTGLSRDGFDNVTEDIFVSEKVDDVWQPAKKLKAPFNTVFSEESPQGISTDGNTMILFGNFAGSLGGGDIFFADKTSWGWSDSKHYPEPINSPHFDGDAKLTGDGNALIFVSDRPGGIGEYRKYGDLYAGSLYGNTDIYIVEKTSDSTWGEATNLGSIINTEFSERNPFLHPDGKTLYFSSEGHPGLGRQDVFMSKRLDMNRWDKWSVPVNFGKEINTPSNDRGAIVSTMGDLAYFASAERNLNFGQSDIYSIDLPEHLRPEAVTAISGKVIDTDGFPLEADIVWEDLTTGKQIGKLRSNPLTGAFFIVFPHGKNYGFYAEREDYFPISKNLDLRKKKKRSEKITENIILYSLSDLLGDDLELSGGSDLLYDQFQLKRKRKIRMNNLFFAYNKWNLLPESRPELNRVAFLLNNYPIDLIEVGGHTDSLGDAGYNEILSKRRANSVLKYLVKAGVDKSKLIAKGYGPSDPVASNEDEEGQAQNRRVELVVLKSGKQVKVDKGN